MERFKDLNEDYSSKKTYRTSTRLTYRQAKRICKNSETLVEYLRKHKDEYFEIGEINNCGFEYIINGIFGERKTQDDWKDYEAVKELAEEVIHDVFTYALRDKEDGNIRIWRAFFLESDEDVNYDDLGNCWAWSYENLGEFMEYFVDRKEGENLYIMEGYTELDNVDWITSICLNMAHSNEHEIRVYDPSEIHDTYIESYDEDTYRWDASLHEEE